MFKYEDLFKYPNTITRELINDLDKALNPYNIYHYIYKAPYIKAINHNNEIQFIFNWDNTYNSNKEITNLLNKIANYFTVLGLVNKRTKRALIFKYKDLYNYLFIKKMKGDTIIL